MSEIKWISVQDELPEKYMWVWVTDGKNICLHYKQSGCNYEGSLGEDLYPLPPMTSYPKTTEACCNIEEGTITHWIHFIDLLRHLQTRIIQEWEESRGK